MYIYFHYSNVLIMVDKKKEMAQIVVEMAELMDKTDHQHSRAF